MLNEPGSRSPYCSFIRYWQTLPGGSSGAVDCHYGRHLVIPKWKTGGCQRAQCWPLLVERAQWWLQIIWFNLFLGIKLAFRIGHFAVPSRRLHSRIKLENCSFGRLRRMHNADLYPFDCHCCGLKEPWHCLSVWLWLFFRVHWEEKWSWNPWWLSLEVLVWLVGVNMVVICLIVAVAHGYLRHESLGVDEAVRSGC